jgi:hypothetical protein
MRHKIRIEGGDISELKRRAFVSADLNRWGFGRGSLFEAAFAALGIGVQARDGVHVPSSSVSNGSTCELPPNRELQLLHHGQLTFRKESFRKGDFASSVFREILK